MLELLVMLAVSVGSCDLATWEGFSTPWWSLW